MAFLFTELGGYMQRRRDAGKVNVDKRAAHKAWLLGLRAELEHLRACIDEIRGILRGPGVPTKRLNSDFVEMARFKFFEYDEESHFLESLTTTYRNIVHTNGMLDRLENNIGIRGNAMASMNGVSGSVDGLKGKVDAKLEAYQK